MGARTIWIAADAAKLQTKVTGRSGDSLQAAIGTSLRLRFGLFENASLENVSGFTAITVEVKPVGADENTAAIMQEVLSSGSINSALTLSQWNALTGSHLDVTFTPGETNNAEAGVYLLCVWGVEGAVKKVWFSQSIEFIQDGCGETTTSPLPVDSFYTSAEVDALLGSYATSAEVKTYSKSVATVAALKALDVTSLSTGYTALVRGRNSDGDTLGGTYRYVSSSSATDNSTTLATVIQPTSGSGRWLLFAIATSVAFGAQDPIGFLANRIAEGTTTTIDWRGDSTYYGHPNPAWAPIPIAQAAVRSHYNNTSAVFLNNGISGWGTPTIIADWDNQMNTVASDAVVIGYGANDAQGATSAAITADVYADNLRAMTLIARARGKIVVFETPVPFWDYGSIGTQTKAQRSIQFANTMRTVAGELGVPVIDTFKWFEELLRCPKSPILVMDDGIHPTQAGYKARAYFQANFFYRGVEVAAAGYFASIHPSIRHYAGVNDIIAAAGSRTGVGRIANKISIPVLVTEGGLDLFLLTPRWTSGTDIATITVNGTALTPTFSLFVSGTAGNFYVDAPVMALRDALPGAYLIQISGEAAEDVGLYSVLATPTLAFQSKLGSHTGTGLVFERWQSLGDLVLKTSAGNTNQNHGIAEFPMSSLLAETAIRFDATLLGNEGVSIFGTNKADNSFPQGGYVVFLDNTTGFLTVSTAGAGGYVDLVALGATDLRGLAKSYEVVAKTDGTIVVFVDGASVGTYTPVTTLYRGGYPGIYANGASKTVTLKNVKVR